MQTFLTSPSFAESAAHLDDKRLGKQRVENLQIMKALLMPDYGWQNHPAVRMWRGFEPAFLDYQAFVCHEWAANRGFQDTCLEKTTDIYEQLGGWQGSQDDPWWLRNPELFISHRSNLIRKDPLFYAPLFPGVPDDLPYIWPV